MLKSYSIGAVSGRLEMKPDNSHWLCGMGTTARFPHVYVLETE